MSDDTILIIDCETGEQTERPLTEEEQRQREADRQEFLTRKENGNDGED